MISLTRAYKVEVFIHNLVIKTDSDNLNIGDHDYSHAPTALLDASNGNNVLIKNS